MFIMRGEITNLKLTSVLVLSFKLFALNLPMQKNSSHCFKEFVFPKVAASFWNYLTSRSHLFNESYGFGKKSIINDLARHDTR